MAPAFVEKVKQMPFAMILKYSSMLMGGVLALFGIFSFFTSFFSFSPSGIIIGFYLVLGGAMMVLGELGFAWYLSRVNFQSTHAGRGVFIFFVGSLTFAISGGSVVSIIIMVLGAVAMILGLAHIGYFIFALKFSSPSTTVAAKNSSTGYYSSDMEMRDSNFDPNIYADISDPSLGVAAPYDPIKNAASIPDAGDLTYADGTPVQGTPGSYV